MTSSSSVLYLPDKNISQGSLPSGQEYLTSLSWGQIISLRSRHRSAHIAQPLLLSQPQTKILVTILPVLTVRRSGSPPLCVRGGKKSSHQNPCLPSSSPPQKNEHVKVTLRLLPPATMTTTGGPTSPPPLPPQSITEDGSLPPRPVLGDRLMRMYNINTWSCPQ